MENVSTYTPLGSTDALIWPGMSMPLPEDQEVWCTKAEEFRGLWYANTPLDSPYRYKYSGGLGTYCCKHRSMAIYSARADKTFFVWGGRDTDGAVDEPAVLSNARGAGQALHMISWYDHATKRLGEPITLFDKWNPDAHDNPTLTIDDAGFIWVFSPSHGTATTPSFALRSREPLSLADGFERVLTTFFSYPQPWNIPGKGLALMHTQYEEWRRFLAVSRSEDGRSWSAPQFLAKVERGHYQVSEACGQCIVTAFDFHPMQGGLERRTNLYILRSGDGGATWTTMDGRPVVLPLVDSVNPALVRDYRAEGRLVYLKDVAFDAKGHPAVLYITSRVHESGPENGPREWTIAHWIGATWVYHAVTTSDNNYDHGELYIESDGTWRIIGPTEPGPQPFNPGGEVAMWTSRDTGCTWRRERLMTAGSPRNHTYVRRPVHAHPDFYAFWADGHGREPSPSDLYYCNNAGDVTRMRRG